MTNGDLFFLYIQSSIIAGKGVFTKKNISQGKRICFLEGKICPLEEMIQIVNEGTEELSDPLGIDDELYIDLDELFRTFNHSCEPNTFIKGKNELIALRDIQKGEEITYDYSTTMNENEEKIKKAGRTLWTCTCNCNSPLCRRIIDQFSTLPKERQMFYIKNQFMPEFMLKTFMLST